jgi:hypothetical protein
VDGVDQPCPLQFKARDVSTLVATFCAHSPTPPGIREEDAHYGARSLLYVRQNALQCRSITRHRVQRYHSLSSVYAFLLAESGGVKHAFTPKAAMFA